MNVDQLNRETATINMDNSEDDVIIIVQYLNEPPFSMNLRLVDFCAKPNSEVIEILDSVLREIGTTLKVKSQPNASQHRFGADFSQQNDPFDQRDSEHELLSFFSMLKCPLIPPKENESIEWFTMMRNGHKSVLYPLLKWMLCSMERLKKRTYLIPFLTPIDIPQQFLSSSHNKQGILFSMADRYRLLQTDFKQLHKRYDSQYYKDNFELTLRLKTFIEKLAQEKKQLLIEIQMLQDASQKYKSKNFPILFEAIGTLRHAKQENSRLNEEITEQREILTIEKNKLINIKQYIDKLDELTFSSLVDPSLQSSSIEDLLDTILDGVRDEVQRLQRVVEVDLLATRKILENDIESLEMEALEPCRSKDEVKEVQSIIDQLRKQRKTKSEMLLEYKAKIIVISSEIPSLLSEVDRKTDKAQCKEVENNVKRERVEVLRSNIRELTSILQSRNDCVDGNIKLPDGSAISKSDLITRTASIEAKMLQLKESRGVLEHQGNELVHMKRTIFILGKNLAETEEKMIRMEEKAGISGFHQTCHLLNKTEEQESHVNGLKTEALHDINDMVKVITTNLESKRESFKPLIQKLKAIRHSARALEVSYLEKKSKYDEIVLSYSSSLMKLEEECDKIQEKWLEAERRYHFLAQSIESVQMHLECAASEDRYQQGAERFSLDFPSIKAWYFHQGSVDQLQFVKMQKELDAIEKNEHDSVQQVGLGYMFLLDP